MFDEIMPAYHTQQQTLQLQSIAHHHSMPLTYGASASPHAGYHRSTDVTPAATPIFSTSPLPPAGYAVPSSAGRRSASDATSGQQPSNVMPNPVVAAEKRPRVDPEPVHENESVVQEPERPKKKRRVALTKVGDIGS